MQLTFLLACTLAFFSAFAVVLWVGMAIQALFVTRERQWALAQASHSSRFDAFNDFFSSSVYDYMIRFPTVQRISRQVARNVGRAGLPVDARTWVSATLYQGVIVALVLGVVLGVLLGVGGVFIGIALAALWSLWIKPFLLDADAESRSRAVYRRIPYALDLCVLVLETGGTLREGLEEVAQHKDPLAEELRVALLEMDSGATQAAALKSMAKRVGLESLETIVLAINRGEETGAPMVNTLVMQAEMFRERRLQEIEKLAVEAPAKMTFPNMMIMLAVLLLIVGPLVIQLADSEMF